LKVGVLEGTIVPIDKNNL